MRPEPTIDRVSPGQHPARRPVHRQRWEHALFLHWPVASARLRGLVPAGLDLDTFAGSAWVSVVAFSISGPRARLGLPVPFVPGFHQVNLRTYVHHKGQAPGVWFLSLDAAHPMVALFGRAVWRLPYHRAHITVTQEASGAWVQTAERVGDAPARFHARYQPDGAPQPFGPGTLNHFLTERYFLYSRGRLSGLRRARIHHAPWPTQPVQLLDVAQSLSNACGLPLPREPELAHHSGGVDVELFSLERVKR